MRIVPISLLFALAATPALAAITVSAPFPEPSPPAQPDQICVWVFNDGAADEKLHVSLYDVQIPGGGATPTHKASYSPASPTQEVTVPAKRTIRRGTITAEVGGSLRVCWKVTPIPGHTYWAIAGGKVDKDGDVPISEGDYGSFRYTPKGHEEKHHD